MSHKIIFELDIYHSKSEGFWEQTFLRASYKVHCLNQMLQLVLVSRLKIIFTRRKVLMCLRTQLVRMLQNRSCLLLFLKSFFIFKIIIFNTSINLTCLLPKGSIRVNASDIYYPYTYFA